MRALYDMSDLDAGRIITTTGQSGQPFSRHANDWIGYWLANETVPLPFSAEAIDAASAASWCSRRTPDASGRYSGQMTPGMQEWMRWEPTKGRRFSSWVLTPARVVVGVGAAMAIVAGLLPWAEGIGARRSAASSPCSSAGSAAPATASC